MAGAANDNIIELAIESVAFGGSGVGHCSGKVCFVPNTLPGEVVRAGIVREKKDFMVAELVQALSPSPERMAPVCPLAGRLCPGCAYQHMQYACEVRCKEWQFRDFIGHVAGHDRVVFRPPVKSAAELYYRNKLALHARFDGGDKHLGYVMADNCSVLDIAACPLASDAINAKLKALRDGPGFVHTLRDGMTVTFRETAHDGVRFWRNSPPRKLSWLKEETVCGTIAVPAGSFAQVNPGVRDALLNSVRETLQAELPDAFLDLYCGSGLFSVAAAEAGVAEIIGADSDAAGIQAAEYNLSGRGAMAKFIAGESAAALPAMLRQVAARRTALAADPPRSGLDAKTLNLLCASGLERIIYISCAPDTLQRDLRVLCANGFSIETAGLFDMFPRTAHFETITWLRRKK